MGVAVSTPLVLMPDAERLLSAFLRDHADVRDLVDDRVYSEFPRGSLDKRPFAKIHILGGPPRLGPMRWLQTARIQVDVWGGPKAQASLVAETIAAACAADLVGTHDDGVVTGVDVETPPAYLPDADLSDPPTPRYTFDVVVTYHPHPNQEEST
jgi:hypothetical protein